MKIQYEDDIEDEELELLVQRDKLRKSKKRKRSQIGMIYDSKGFLINNGGNIDAS